MSQYDLVHDNIEALKRKNIPESHENIVSDDKGLKKCNKSTQTCMQEVEKLTPATKGKSFNKYPKKYAKQMDDNLVESAEVMDEAQKEFDDSAASDDDDCYQEDYFSDLSSDDVKNGSKTTSTLVYDRSNQSKHTDDPTRDVRPKTTTKPEADAERLFISALYQKLAKSIGQCTAITGFAKSRNGDKIEIDISTDENDAVEKFLQQNFPTDYAAQRFDVIVQDDLGEFLVNTGTKIVSGDDATNESLIGRPAVELHGQREFGTVTCLAEEAHAAGSATKAFVLTSHHAINQNRERCHSQPDGQSGSGKYVSIFQGTVELVSEYYYGILAPVELNGENYNIDIAALKLHDSVQENLFNGPYSCALHELVAIYTGDDNHLEGMAVSKNGAATGVTCGKITGSYCFRYEGQTEAGDVLLVESLDPKKPFATKGDSGSLVWSANGQPIGIVSYQKACGRQLRRKTCVVRLDRCIEALRKRGYIQDLVCKTHGPAINYQAQPGTILQTPSL